MKRKPGSPTETSPEPFVLDTPIETPPVDVPSAPLAEPAGDKPPPPPPPRLGIFAPLLGGALAAAAGFTLAHFNALGLRPDAPVDVAALEARQAEALAALRADQTTGLDALATRIDDLSQRLAEAEATPATPTVDPALLDALDTRLKAIEAMPPGGDASTTSLAAALADLEGRVEALGTVEALPAELSAKVDAALAEMAEAEAAATARADEAAAVAEATRQRTALQDLRAAVDSGASFDSRLATVADPDLQAALADTASTGLPTLAALQDSFPDAARSALTLARAADTDDGWGARLVDFLAAQTGARSLTPREGTDPDAILSRAEAAVQDGRLSDALTELAALDPAIAAPLADWTASARLRLDAEQALEAAATRLQGPED